MGHAVWLDKALQLVAAGMLLLMASCTQNPETALREETNTGGIEMDAELNRVVDRTVPPIDAAAPETFETATFGLG